MGARRGQERGQERVLEVAQLTLRIDPKSARNGLIRSLWRDRKRLKGDVERMRKAADVPLEGASGRSARQSPPSERRRSPPLGQRGPVRAAFGGDAIEYSSEPPKRPERPFPAFLANHAHERTTNER
jgi:hypothetical protein